MQRRLRRYQIGGRGIHGSFPSSQCGRCVVEVLFGDDLFMAEFRDAIVIALGVIEIRAGLNCCGPSLKHLCSCLLERDFKIALVEYNECLPCFD